VGGDVLILKGSSQARFQIRCINAQGCRLQLFDQEKELSENEVTGSDQLNDYHLTVSTSRFVRAELHNSDGLMMALTNPVYLDNR
jgi:hypothetical protein